MALKNLMMTAVGGTAAVCALTAGLVWNTDLDFGITSKAESSTTTTNGADMDAMPALNARGTVATRRTAAADNAEAHDHAHHAKVNAQPARPDEPMSPDQYEPSELSKMGDDLRHHPRDLAQLMEQLKKETDPEKIKLLAQLIAQNAEAAGYELPIKDLIEMAASEDPTKRLAAVMLLGSSTQVTPEMIQTISGLARGDATDDVRLLAINAMGRWMDRNSNLSEQLSMEIIGARDASTDAGVRGYAIQTVGLQKNGLPASLVAPVSESLRIEAVAENRSIAALALSHSEPAAQPQALQNLQSAYHAETDLDAKRHLVTMMVRSSGDKAADILKNLQASEPLVQQDIKDYMEIIASGETDVNRIYELKNQRDGDRGTEIDTDAACLQ